MDNNLPAIAGDMGSVPELGRPHMLWSNIARAPQLPRSVCHGREATAGKPRQGSHGSEKPVHHHRGQPSPAGGEHRGVPAAVVAWGHGHWTTRKSHYLHFTYLRAMKKKKKKILLQTTTIILVSFP